MDAFIRVAELAREGGADRARQVFSHWSAAALWGYPIIGAWPSRIHVTLPSRSGQRSTRGVVRHLEELSDTDVVERDGMCITSPTRTIADLARAASFATGVAACDRAFALRKAHDSPDLHVERDALLEIAEKIVGQRGVCRLRSVADFADGRSGSPGESFSRVQIARLHLPVPDLQVEVIDRDGQAWHSDFGWPGVGLLGEFDGMTKYTSNRYLMGRDVADIVIEEKLREEAPHSECGRTRGCIALGGSVRECKRRGAHVVSRGANGKVEWTLEKATRPGCSKCSDVADSSSSILCLAVPSGRITTRQCIGQDLSDQLLGGG